MVETTEQSSPPQLVAGQTIDHFEIVAPLRTRHGQPGESRSRSRTNSRPAGRGEQGQPRSMRGGQADLYLVRPRSARTPRWWLSIERSLLGDSPALVQRHQLGVLKITEPKYAKNLIDELDYLFRVEHARLVKPYSLCFPNIIPAHLARRPLTFKDGDSEFPYILLVYEAGGSLLDYLRARGGGRQSVLSPGQAVEVAAQVGEVLHVLHEAKVVHRDIAPANLVLHRRIGVLQPQAPEVVLIDLAAANSFPRQRLREPWGRWRYLPPESQPRQQPGDPEPQNSPQTDIYMLGLLLYELLTGPLEQQNAQQRRDRGQREKPIAERNPAVVVSPELQGLVAQAISRDVNQRTDDLPTMADFVRRLRGLPEARQEHRLRGTPTARHLVTALLVVLLALAIAGSMLVVGGPAPAPTPSAPAVATTTVVPSQTPTLAPSPTSEQVRPTITSVPRP